jgi:hypothetical protein
MEKTNILTVNFICIENTFIYKLKDLLKNKDPKYVIDYNSLLDKTADDKEKDLLIGSLIIKKLKKIISKEKDKCIFYVLNSISENKIKNITNLISKYFEGQIILNAYTDNKIIKKEIFNNFYKPEHLKNDSN